MDQYEGHGIVAFVDLLGFRNEIYDNWDREINNPLNRIKELYKFVNDNLRDPEGQTFLDKDESTLIDKAKYGKTLSVSDSFTIMIPFDKTDNLSFLLSLLSVSGSILTLIRKSIELGFVLRGAISYGELYWAESTIVGKPFIDVYLLETKHADNARIILSNDLSNRVHEILSSTEHKIIEYFKHFFDIDEDDYTILNPVVAYGYYYPENCKFASQKIKAIRENSPEKVRYKYDDLINRLENIKYAKEDFIKFKKDVS